MRVLPPVDGHDRFSESAGTKRLKPDLEASCPMGVDGERAVLLLGSGSTGRRRRGVVVRLVDGRPVVHAVDLDGLGYRKLPDASRALGRSLRIFKSEVGDLRSGANGRLGAPGPPRLLMDCPA